MAEPKLLDQYRERLRVKHYSLRTEDAYLGAACAARLTRRGSQATASGK